MSAAAKTQTARASAPSQPGFGPHAPSVTLPLRFMVTGMLALFTGVSLLLLRPEMLATYHYNQYVIATTHLFVLGWICTIVMGAMYQLVPVALETKLYSESWRPGSSYSTSWASPAWSGCSGPGT